MCFERGTFRFFSSGSSFSTTSLSLLSKYRGFVPRTAAVGTHDVTSTGAACCTFLMIDNSFSTFRATPRCFVAALQPNGLARTASRCTRRFTSLPIGAGEFASSNCGVLSSRRRFVLAAAALTLTGVSQTSRPSASSRTSSGCPRCARDDVNSRFFVSDRLRRCDKLSD